MPQEIDFGRSFRYKKEGAGTPNVAPGALGGQIVRRLPGAMFSLNKDAVNSAEVRTDYQRVTGRHGARSVEGVIPGELAPNAYTDFFAAGFKAPFAAGASSGALTTIAATVSGNILTLTRSAGSWLTDNHILGDVVRQTGWTTTATTNNNKNGRIIALSASAMSIADLQGAATPWAAKVAGDSVTVSSVGKRCAVPITGHTADTFWWEVWNSTIGKSEQFGGTAVSQIALSLSGGDKANVTFNWVGMDMQPSASAPYFTAPSAPPAGDMLSSSAGRLRLFNGDNVIVTSVSLTIAAQQTLGKVVGSNLSPGVFAGQVTASGELTAYFEDTALQDAYVNETEGALNLYLTATTAANSPFMNLGLPRIKLFSSTPGLEDNKVIRTYRFEAYRNELSMMGPGTLDTTIYLQDSAVP